MQKVRYEIDPYNRLIASDGAAGLSKFRKVLDGEFKADEYGTLSYHIKSPLDECDNIPNQVRLKGAWSLDENHSLRLTLDKSSRDTFGDEITLQGEILDVNENSLLFAITTKKKDNTLSTYVLDLGGSWRADENNKLSFRIKRAAGIYDILTFNGTWDIGRNNQIVYQYQKARLVTKKRQVHTLVFKGYWDIRDRLRLSYVLSGSTDSAFDFTVKTGIFKEGLIKYEVGISLEGRARPEVRTIILSGRWNLKKDMGLVFETAYGGSSRRSIVFGADARLTDKDTISFRLKKGEDNKDIGASLELSRKILKGGGEAYLRAMISGKESAIYAGAAWRW